MNLLSDKCAVITGGSDGIGLGIARAFVEAGAAQLLLIGRDEAKLAAARTSLAGQTTVHTLAADLANPSGISTLAERIGATLPRLDILVNNAGLGRFVPFADSDEALFDAHFNLNVKAPYFLTQALLPALTAARGNVLNISYYLPSACCPAGPPASIPPPRAR